MTFKRSNLVKRSSVLKEYRVPGAAHVPYQPTFSNLGLVKVHDGTPPPSLLDLPFVSLPPSLSKHLSRRFAHTRDMSPDLSLSPRGMAITRLPGRIHLQFLLPNRGIWPLHGRASHVQGWLHASLNMPSCFRIPTRKGSYWGLRRALFKRKTLKLQRRCLVSIGCRL